MPMDIIYKESPKEFSFFSYCDIILEAYADSIKKFNIDSSTGDATPQKLIDLVSSKKGTVFAAYHSDRMIGGAILTKYFINTWYYKGEVCETKYLAVAPGFQRMGIARQLKSMIFKKLRKDGLNAIISTVNANNEASLKLQMSDGYIPVDTYVGYHNHRTIKLLKCIDFFPHDRLYYSLRYNIKKICVEVYMKIKKYN